jgi:hypothetical protein
MKSILKPSKRGRSVVLSRSENGEPSHLKYTVRPGIHTQIAVKMLPGAACRIYGEHDDNPERRLKAYADQEGIVRFHVQPSEESDKSAALVVECLKGREVYRKRVHLRPSFEPNADMSAPPKELPLACRPGARVRPGLSFDEAIHLTNKEALARGYPFRPDPESSPNAFNVWLRAVSAPAVQIEPHPVSNPEICHGKAKQHGPATSSNWSGFELLRWLSLRGNTLRRGEPYDWVAGTWIVPAVTGQNGGRRTYSALWVGLDGDGTTDLVQAGTEQDSMKIWLPLIGDLSLSTYYIWTEFLPQQPTEQVISNFTVSPGDEILTEVWVGTGDNEPSLGGASGRFFIMNLSTGGFAWLSTPRGGTQVSGTEAVWIMERPTVSGSLPSLANYSSAVIYNASARIANSARYQGFESYLGVNKQQTMVNGADVLSTVTAIDANSMRFDWKAFS